MEIAILLPVFNNLDFTRSTLEELGGLRDGVDGANFNIVLIDDGSTDGTSEWVQQNHPEVILLHGDGNLWWSGAINMGAQYAIEKIKEFQKQKLTLVQIREKLREDEALKVLYCD